jgi:hypothetical protein
MEVLYTKGPQLGDTGLHGMQAGKPSWKGRNIFLPRTSGRRPKRLSSHAKEWKTGPQSMGKVLHAWPGLPSVISPCKQARRSARQLTSYLRILNHDEQAVRPLASRTGKQSGCSLISPRIKIRTCLVQQ